MKQLYPRIPLPWCAFVIPLLCFNGVRGQSEYIDPLIGTRNGGHVFPGATLPFGMAKAVADVTGENHGGFGSDGTSIFGFSHMHDSGTGGSPSLGNFPIFPISGCLNDDLSKCPFLKRDRAEGYTEVHAHPGYFMVTLNSSIRTEITVTEHAALYRFTFPNNSTSENTTLSPMILADLSDLPNTRSNGQISVDSSTGRISGNGTYGPSFGNGRYMVYFCMDISGAELRDTGTFGADGSIGGSGFGAWSRFRVPGDHQLVARVGVSFMSTAQACQNGEYEAPDFDFGDALRVAERAWDDKLSVIQIDSEGVDEDILKTFWSGVYRTFISPQDYTGENPLWNSTEPYYDSFYCIWDSFRSIHPLITLVDPVSQTKMIRSLIDIYRHLGKLPDCRMSLCKGFTQGGSNADIVLADAYVKGLKDGIDWNIGYEAVVSDAEVEPPNWDLEGRGGLVSWKALGYIPKNDEDSEGTGTHTRSVSRTVEYGYDDFCIAEIAKGLGKAADYDKYMNRSQGWKNLFKADQTSSINGKDTGFVGFLQPKYFNSTWAFQDPIHCSPLEGFDDCYFNPSGGETYEGSLWMYTFFVPGDMATLVETLGGPEKFVQRLDFLHESGLLYIGDEQAFLPVFQYHHAGRPGRSSYRAHSYIPSQFNASLNGIPGNDDSGSMGSFAALTMMGIFPNPGQNVYYITPPFFREVSIQNPQTGKVATVRNTNFDPAYKNIYVQNALLNGEVYTKNWIDHSFFVNGGTLELVLGPTESAWGTGDDDLPPSLSKNGPADRVRT